MPSRAEIVSFDESPPPGANPCVGRDRAARRHRSDRSRPGLASRQYDGLASRIQGALGSRVLQIEYVGSAAVPGPAAKPIIDIDLTALKLTLRIVDHPGDLHTFQVLPRRWVVERTLA
jgi:GrpB protein